MHLPVNMSSVTYMPQIKKKKTSELSMLRPALKLRGYQGFSSVACAEQVSAYYNYH